MMIFSKAASQDTYGLLLRNFLPKVAENNPLRRNPKVPLLLSQIAALLWSLACPAFGFDTSYRYDLVYGKSEDVCRHMLAVYRQAFVKPWEVDPQATASQDATIAGTTAYSYYPTSPEFRAIDWRVHRYQIAPSLDKIFDPALYSEFDIDNDGVNELVIHLGFFTGSPGSRDYFWIFPLGAVDFTEFRTHADFLERIAPKRKALLGHPVHQRPFVYNGRTYMHGYTFTPRRSPGANPSEPFAPPEYVLINQYLGGPAKDADEQRRSHSMKLICRYKMTQVNR